MSEDELVPDEPGADEGSEVVLDPPVKYGEQDEAAQEGEWEEDVKEGGG